MSKHESAPPPWHKVRLWEIQFLRDIFLIVAILALLWLGALLSVVTVPLLIGLGLAYICEPMIAWLGSRFSWATRSRILAAVVILILVCGSIFAIFTVPRVIGQSIDIVRNRSVYAQRLQQMMEQEWMPEVIREQFDPVWELLGVGAQQETAAYEEDAASEQDTLSTLLEEDQETERIRALIQDELDQHLGLQLLVADPLSPSAARYSWLGSAQIARFLHLTILLFGSIFDLLLFVFLSLFFFISMSISFPRVVERAWSLTPQASRARLRFLVGRMDQAVSGFVRGRLLICAIMAVAYGIGWSIFGVPHALVLALVTGVLGLIPFAAVIMLPVSILLVAISVGGGSPGYWYSNAEGAVLWWAVPLFPSLVFIIVQIADDYVMTPIIQGKTTNLDVVSIIIAVIAGGSFAGLYGMLLAVPVAACLRILWLEVVLPRIYAWSEGRRPDPLPVGNANDDAEVPTDAHGPE